MGSAEHTVENGDIELFLWEKFPQESLARRVVVLAHGSGTGGKVSFDLQVPGSEPTYSLMDRLVSAGFTVFAPDVRGFGRSTHPQTHTEIAQHYSDLNAVVDFALRKTGAQTVDLVAWSYGTQYAGLLVMRQARKIRRYVAYAMHHAHSPGMIKRRSRLEHYRRNVYVQRSEADWKRRFYSSTPPQASDAEVVERYARAAAETETLSPTGPDLERMSSAIPFVSPKLITVPTMLIHGQYDDQADLDGGLPFFERLANPYKKYVVVPNAGHIAHLQAGYAVFQREVVSWLSDP